MPLSNDFEYIVGVENYLRLITSSANYFLIQSTHSAIKRSLKRLITDNLYLFRNIMYQHVLVQHTLHLGYLR